MHDTKRWRLICYDIRDPKRWRRAHKLLKGFGDPVQLSLFRCRLDDRQLAELRAKLAKILTAEDDLLVIALCPSCAERVLTTNAEEAWDRPPPSFSVVLRSSASTSKKEEQDDLPHSF